MRRKASAVEGPIGVAIEGGEAAQEFLAWLWVQWRDHADLKDVIQHTIRRALCSHHPDDATVSAKADAIARRVLGEDKKKAFLLWRPVKRATRFTRQKFTRKSELDRFTWPGWEEDIQRLVVLTAGDIKLGDGSDQRCCKSWAPDMATLAERVPDSLVKELLDGARANPYRRQMLFRLKESDELSEHFGKSPQPTTAVNFQISAAGLVAIAGGLALVFELIRVRHTLLIAAGALGLFAVGVALVGVVLMARRRLAGHDEDRQLIRDFAKGWAAGCLTAITGRQCEPEADELTSELALAVQEVAVAQPNGGDGRLRLGNGTNRVPASLACDLRERLLPRATDCDDKQLRVSLLRVEDALIRFDHNGPGGLLNALVGLIAIATEADRASLGTGAELETSEQLALFGPSGMARASNAKDGNHAREGALWGRQEAWHGTSLGEGEGSS